MAVYPNAIAEALEKPKHAGSLPGAASGRAVNFDCGGFIEVSVEVSEDSGVVSTARFRSNGCGFMVAAADAACSKLTGAGLENLHGLADLGSLLVEKFGPVHAARIGCFEAVIEAVRGAFRKHRDQVVAEFAGEKALACTCFGISEETIAEFIGVENPATVKEVSDACRAGSGCGSCRMIIQELIDTAERERMMTKT